MFMQNVENNSTSILYFTVLALLWTVTVNDRLLCTTFNIKAKDLAYTASCSRGQGHVLQDSIGLHFLIYFHKYFFFLQFRVVDKAVTHQLFGDVKYLTVEFGSTVVLKGNSLQQEQSSQAIF